MVVRLINSLKMAGVHGDQTFGNEARFRHPRQFVALAKSPQMERCPRTGLGSTGKTCKFRKLKQALNTMASSFNIAGAGSDSIFKQQTRLRLLAARIRPSFAVRFAR